MAAPHGSSMHRILQQLRGGDLRSIGDTNVVVQKARQDPAIFSALVAGLSETDAVLRMRCADALEKISREHPEYLRSHSRKLQDHLSPTEQKEVLWHVLQMVPRIRWGRSRIARILFVVENCLSSKSSIVKTCAMQALVDLVPQSPDLLPHIEALIRISTKRGTLAMKSRGLKLLQQLRGLTVRFRRDGPDGPGPELKP